jgi:hypothetical protein
MIAGTNHRRDRVEYMLYAVIFHGLLQTLCGGKLPANFRNIRNRKKCLVEFSCCQLFVEDRNILIRISVSILKLQFVRFVRRIAA